MNTHVKTVLTLGVLTALVLLGLTWGWSAMTSPFPQGAAATRICVETTVQPGERVAAPKVTVSVYNASDRLGLADRTMAAFEAQGFGAGKVANAPKGSNVKYAQVWTHEPQNPAVQLVISRLGPKAHVVGKDPQGPGVTVMVGEGFEALVAGKASVKATDEAQICSPPTQ